MTAPAAAAARLPVATGFELWLLDLLVAPKPPELACLSAQERQKAERFVFERDRQRYLSAHVHLRRLLADYTGLPPARLEFTEGPFGKPAMCNVEHCSFNLSHSEDIAVVLIAAEGELGVDVEMLRPMPDALALADRNFSASERQSLRDLQASRRDHAFLAGWTRKEACLKAIGSGLSISPETFTAGLTHQACTTEVPTPTGPERVGVDSYCHAGHLLIAWARAESRTAT